MIRPEGFPTRRIRWRPPLAASLQLQAACAEQRAIMAEGRLAQAEAEELAALDRAERLQQEQQGEKAGEGEEEEEEEEEEDGEEGSSYFCDGPTCIAARKDMDDPESICGRRLRRVWDGGPFDLCEACHNEHPTEEKEKYEWTSFEEGEGSGEDEDSDSPEEEEDTSASHPAFQSHRDPWDLVRNWDAPPQLPPPPLVLLPQPPQPPPPADGSLQGADRKRRKV